MHETSELTRKEESQNTEYSGAYGKHCAGRTPLERALAELRRDEESKASGIELKIEVCVLVMRV